MNKIIQTKKQQLQLKFQILEEERLELNKEIRREMCLELLKLHNDLVAYYLKHTIEDLSIRKRMYNIYLVLITESNIEFIHALSIKVFLQKFYNCELNKELNLK